ncbi:MAG TPA: ABC transporter permease [Bryobacteraceae bacterium]|nr:ABC transporter permease [Bryobacteraceae bacterium]
MIPAMQALEPLWQDVRYALRTMRRAPGFTFAAVLTLALGIGANTAIFSLVNALMLHMLPVRDPGRLVALLSKYPGEPRGSYFSLDSYRYYRDHNDVFAGVIADYSSPREVSADGLDPEIVDGETVSGNFFPVLGVEPAIGRLLGPEDDREGAAGSAVAVVSWSWWKTRFHRDPSILGKRLIVDGTPVQIIGVTPREFAGVQMGASPDLWVPLAVELMGHGRSRIGRGGLQLMARLKAGMSVERAGAEMRVLFRYTIEERARTSRDPLVRQLTFELAPAGTGFSRLRDLFAQPLVVLMGLVALLLLIACTSLATLLLARGAARQRDLAARVALGASRPRLARQVLTESLLLAGAGALGGILVAYFGAGALVRILASGRPIPGMPPRLEIRVEPDGRV